MATEEHLEMIKQGVDKWNAWREDNPEVTPDLDGAELAGMTLQGANLRSANLRRANIEYANLREARLDQANLRGSYLTGANLERAKLTNCDLRDAQILQGYFHNAILTRAKFSSSYLWGCHFVGASIQEGDFRLSDLTNANLMRADLRGANVDDADLRGVLLDDANLSDAYLQRSDLSGASLNGAILQNCDVRDVKNLELDETLVRGAKFSATAKDQWSVLRRSYTGPMFVFHLLFLLAFLVPYVAKSLFWAGVNRGQDAYSNLQREIESAVDAVRDLDEAVVADINQAMARLWEEKQLDPAVWYIVEQGLTHSPLNLRTDIATNISERLAELGPCLQKIENCEPPRPVGLVLLGAGKGWLKITLAISLLLYNICRAILTRQVNLLRDAEERSGYSPSKKEYSRMFRIHHPAMLALFWISIIALLVHGWDLLIETKVILPKAGF